MICSNEPKIILYACYYYIFVREISHLRMITPLNNYKIVFIQIIFLRNYRDNEKILFYIFHLLFPKDALSRNENSNILIGGN